MADGVTGPSDAAAALVDRADLDELTRFVDRLAAGAEWDEVLRVRDLCRAALQRGRQLWPVASRCEYVGGNFFDGVPAGADTYVLKRILYSWDDERATKILRVVRSAMRPDSRLLVLEPVQRRGDAFDIGKVLDLQMLVLGGGFVRDRKLLRVA